MQKKGIKSRMITNNIDYESAYYGFNDYIGANKLSDAFYHTEMVSSWKEMTQHFQIHVMLNLYKLQLALLTGEFKQDPFYEFDINERGKPRHIKAQITKDRVVQRTVSDNILAPSLTPYLIYDNGASIKNKGVTFSRNRMTKHLTEYIKHHGIDGWILQIDFKGFFDSIPHKELLFEIEKHIDDPNAMKIIAEMVNAFELEGDTNRSLGIGSQISQICGTFYPTKVDTYCKIVRSMKYYGRYMDDIYVISDDKDELEDILKNIKRIADELGLTLSKNKTHITPLHKGFTFLKIKYNILDDGRILRRIVPKAITRERRKLKSYRRKLDLGELPYSEIEQAFKTWYYSYIKFDSRRSVHEVLRLFLSLFCNEIQFQSNDVNLLTLLEKTTLIREYAY